MANTNAETVNTASGKWMLALAALCVVAGLVGFYMLAQQSVFLRAGALLAGLVAGVAIVFISEPGKRLVGFSKESYREVRKVVWPTRKETAQTTMIVFVFMLVMAIFLWSADKLIEWVIFSLVLGWK